MLLTNQERAREEKSAEITGRIREALACGLKVLDDAFDQLEVNSEGGSSVVT